ncbi:hypothetical protein CPU12_05970 [Malaciobacter molluscorum LMG 25693]|uniref:Periplasmic protein n=1 Tax=Malaciobacter molluscorum LMG 25693 TaxID=870501 RepID=A0A2G1DID9_9BACT|nr:hypothetical protein [Malaciobacter molluscorum]AXX91854.1 hypothetical protein AMOL_0860 [Malaciobacter molluscorum LMG 25693]PHO18263.1 hypothetical protein CPU12_05970 [Malaciobacter molluscorum LMG 25693]RXJ94146.1 hypothetical protein CRV00_07915 [Malaciobacter molluscorum]
MKNIIFILVSIFLFFGCAPKQEVQKVQKTNKQVIKDTSKRIDQESQTFENQTKINEAKSIKDEDLDSDVFKLAIIYPSNVVGKYANNTVNTITGYLLYKNQKFMIESFDTSIESIESIQKAYDDLKAKGFKKVIALFTKTGYDIMSSFSYSSNLKVYFPLINSSEVLATKENFIYGGISYVNQIKLLQTLSNQKNIMYYQDNYLGKRLKNYYENIVNNIDLVREIKVRNNDYKALVNDDKLLNSTITLNTSIIQTSILLSQIRAFEKEPKVILSTQINYNPLLVSLTQAEDRVNFVIANSIDKTEAKLEDILDLLGVDIVYDWVNYSSLIGVNQLFDNNNKELIKTKIDNNRVVYDPKLYKNTEYGFQKIK